MTILSILAVVVVATAVVMIFRGHKVPMEHERRFHPTDLSKLPFKPSEHYSVFITQGYLEGSGRERLRKEVGFVGVATYWITKKSGSGISRKEDEHQISKEEFDALWVDVKCSLTKTRYHINWNGVVIEYNVFHDGLTGYYQIEVEFKSHKKALAFIAPEWFGKEVTDDNHHGNYALAKFGLQGILG